MGMKLLYLDCMFKKLVASISDIILIIDFSFGWRKMLLDQEASGGNFWTSSCGL